MDGFEILMAPSSVLRRMGHPVLCGVFYHS
jgi:hypothetical protein